MKIRVVVSIRGTLLAIVGMLVLSHSAHTQQDVIREHSAANRSKSVSDVEDKTVPQGEALQNVGSVPIGATTCDNAPVGSVQCLPRDSGAIVRKPITTKSVVAGTKRDAANSIVEKIVIAPQKVGVRGRSEATAGQPPATESIAESIPVTEQPESPAEIVSPNAVAPALQDNPAQAAAAINPLDAVVSTTAEDAANVDAEVQNSEVAGGQQDFAVDATTDSDADSGEALGQSIIDSDDVVNAEASSLAEDSAVGLVPATSNESNELTSGIPTADTLPTASIDTLDEVADSESIVLEEPSVDVEGAALIDGDASQIVGDDSDFESADTVVPPSAVADVSVIDSGVQDDIVPSIPSASTDIAPTSNIAPIIDSAQFDIAIDEPDIANAVVNADIDTPSSSLVAAAIVDDSTNINAPLSPDDGVAQQITIADQLLADGQPNRARQLLAGIDTSQPLPPLVIEKGAMLATTLNLVQVARRLWEQNITESEPYRSTALMSLVELSVASGSLAGADIYLQSMLQYNIVPSERSLLTITDYYLDSARFEEAMELIAIFSEAYPDSQYFDSLLWYTGRLHESYPNQQGVWSAVRSYRELIAGYPLSDYWERAQARTTYLERHFIDVR